MKASTLCVALAALTAAVLLGSPQGRAGAVVVDAPASQWAQHEPIDVSGTWLSDRIRIRSSSCPAALTDVVREEIGTGNLSCTFIIDQTGLLVRVVEICPDETIEFVARVDPSGELRRSESTAIDGNHCHWLFINTFSAQLGHSPTTITSMYLFEFDASCGVPDCAIEITGRLQRVEVAEHASPFRTRAACNSGGHRSAAEEE
jgi:hypothetical protein